MLERTSHENEEFCKLREGYVTADFIGKCMEFLLLYLSIEEMRNDISAYMKTKKKH